MTEFNVFGPLQDPPPGATILFPIWVFAHKLNGDGVIVDEKARLVVNRSKQKEGRTTTNLLQLCYALNPFGF